jgi:hypothetical protein
MLKDAEHERRPYGTPDELMVMPTPRFSVGKRANNILSAPERRRKPRNCHQDIVRAIALARIGSRSQLFAK